jgi:hypothetical protein
VAGAVTATVLAVPGVAQARLSWSAPFAVDLQGPPALTAVACPTPGQCTAVADLAEVTFDPAAPARTAVVQIDYGTDSNSNPVTISAVACPSAAQCTAVDSGGQEVTFDPTQPGHPKPVWIDGYQDRDIFSVPLDAIVCQSTTRCIVVDQNGGEVTFNPHHPVAFDPNVGNDTSVTVDRDGNSLNAVACSSSRCTAVGDGGNEVTFNPVSPPATPVLKPVDPGKSLTALVCSSATQCTALDEIGHQLTFNPATGALLAIATVDAPSPPTGSPVRSPRRARPSIRTAGRSRSRHCRRRR